MATTATAADVKTECNLPEVADAVLTPHLASAQLEIQRRLTATRYTALATPTTPFVAADAAALKKGEALLAGAIALPFLNTKTTGQGVVQVTEAKGQGVQTTLLSEAQVQAKAGGWRARAWSILDRYRPAETDDEAEENTAGGLSIGGLRLTPVGGPL